MTHTNRKQKYQLTEIETSRHLKYQITIRVLIYFTTSNKNSLKTLVFSEAVTLIKVICLSF